MFQTSIKIASWNRGDDNNGNKTGTYFVTDSEGKAFN